VSTTPAGDAARLLWDTWTAGTTLPSLPTECAPADIADGYAIQAQLDAFGGERAGWKIAATGAAGRESLGVDHPLAGPLYAQFAVEPGQTIELAPLRMHMVEAEFGFVTAHDLVPANAPFHRDAILEALGAFIPALEFPNTRYADHTVVGGASLVADAACAGLFVLGTPVTDFDPAALPGSTVTLSVGDNSSVGTGANVLGDPVEAVRWLANELGSLGRTLYAGSAIITGAATAATSLEPGKITADYGALGSLEVTLV
jgi:2-keto-4-pentenoate hydratase